MRRTRTALILGVILVGTTTVRAQTAHSIPYNEDTCPHCPTAGHARSAAGGPVGAASWTATLQRTLGGILPGGIGCDARHNIYKSALRRSTFDKKLVPIVPYYEHAFPCYSDRRYRGAPHLSHHGAYPADYASPMMESGTSVREIPSGTGEPTPASKPTADQASTRSIPRNQQSENHGTSDLDQFISWDSEPEKTAHPRGEIRRASSTETSAESRNPLRH